MKQQLVVDLKQSLKLTAGMQQSLNVLQMSSIELNEYIASELDKNPFLEVVEPQDNQSETNEDGSESSTDPDRISNHEQGFDATALVTEKQSLKTHISEQINLDICDPLERIIAIYLLDMLEPSGYITCDIPELAKRFKCTHNVIESTLCKLQLMDPPGVFARDLKECLTLQLKDHNEYNERFAKLLENLELIAKLEFIKLAKICAVSVDDLKIMVMRIKALNPKPGMGFAYEDVIYKIPDVFLEISNNEDISLRLNQDIIPKLSLNRDYHTKIKQSLNGAVEKQFVSAEIMSASNLLKAIDQRSKTLVEIATAIAMRQRDFVLRGIMYFKSITMADIAVDCSMNESTISRAIANKYISTPMGVFELKFFFSSSVDSRQGTSSVSSTKIKELIKNLISAEGSDHILSDDDLSEELLKFNIKVARRTVAKYREALNIPSSASRKRMKR